MKLHQLMFLVFILFSCGTQPEKKPQAQVTENEIKKDDSNEKQVETAKAQNTLISRTDSSEKIINDWEIAQEYAEDLLLNNDIEILTYIDERNQSDSICSEWTPASKEVLKTLIPKLIWEHNSTVHYLYNYYNDCRIKGILVNKKTDTANYYMNPGGHITLVFEAKNIEFKLGCNDSTLKEYFLTIRPTDEEFEKMME